jgi:hypothetical protein
VSANQQVSEKAPKRCFGASCLGKKRVFPVIFRGQISRCGRILALRFSNDVDLKRVRNYLQGLRENLYPPGVEGGGGVPEKRGTGNRE